MNGNSNNKERSHEEVEQNMRESMEWPQYFVSGEGVEDENFVPAYYKVEGPNGPVSYKNPNSGPHKTTMYDFAMEAQSDHFRWCKVEETNENKSNKSDINE